MQLDTVRRLRLETSESGAAEATQRVRTLAQALAGIQETNASLARSYDALARQEAVHRASMASTADSASKMGAAFREVGGLIKDHPVLVTAAIGASARGLGMLSPALASASVATRALANDNTLLATGLGLSSRALAAGATATASASASAARFADALTPGVAAVRLLTTAAGIAAPALGPLGLALGAFKVGAEGIEKAYTDLDKLVEVGKRAEALDVSAPFLKAFSGLGKTLRTEVEQMEEALARASELVRDRFREPNQLGGYLSGLSQQGFTGGDQLQASRLLDTAKSTEERIRAGVVAMTELEALGQRFAELDLAERLFPKSVVDRLRTGQTTAVQLLASLDEARQKEVISQESVARALELNRSIAQTKQEIRDAWSVSLDLSGVAASIDQAWLGILTTVRDVSVTVNEGLASGMQHILEAGDAIDRKFKEWGNAGIWTRISNALPRLQNPGFDIMPPPGAEPFGPAIPRGFQEPVGSRLTTEMFGPAIPPAERAIAAPRGPSAETLSGMQRYILDLEKARDVAKAEFDTIGLGNQARQRAIDLAAAQAAAQRDLERGLRDSATLTDQERQRIIAAADATAQWKDRAKELQDALTFASDATKDFAKTLVGDMRQGKSAIDSLVDALDRLQSKLIDKSIDMAIDGLFRGSGSGGGLNSVIASLLNSGGGASAASSGFSMSGPLTAAEAFGGFARGGMITGPGTGTSDSILARVSNREYIVNAEATRQHFDLLEAINRGLPRFAEGGPVAVPSQALLPRGGGGWGAPVLNFNVESHGAEVERLKVSPGPNGSWNVDMAVRVLRRAIDADRAKVGQAGAAFMRG